MSQVDLRRIMIRASLDEEFAQRVKDDPVNALADYDLSPEELKALRTRDEALLGLLVSTANVPPTTISVSQILSANVQSTIVTANTLTITANFAAADLSESQRRRMIEHIRNEKSSLIDEITASSNEDEIRKLIIRLLSEASKDQF